MTESKAIVAILRTPKIVNWRIKFDELKLLAKTAGYEIVGETVQFKPAPLSSTLFGKGKIQEIRDLADRTMADTLIVWNNLKSIQKFNLERFIGLKVIDRYELVLEIFQHHAGDNLAKLQIELAYLEKLIPYYKLREKLIHGSSDKPFFRAGGQYGWVPKVAWLRKRRKKILEEITHLLNEKLAQIKNRKKLGFKIVTLIGYYNAGKTSLFNILTREDKPVSPTPFTTLASKYSRLVGQHKILLVDTIGFVSDLDPKIISSFRINLEDLVEADLLIWVIDASEEDYVLDIRISATAEILRRNDLVDKPMIVAANKIDLLNKTELTDRLTTIKGKIRKYLPELDTIRIIPTSAITGAGIEDLVKEIIDLLEDNYEY